MTLELTFLGSGNAFASAPERYWSSFLANGRYLFDAPPTLLPHLKRLGMAPTNIEVVFISHFHGDHFMGLPFLFLEHVYLTERRDDLFIVGPPGVGKYAVGQLIAEQLNCKLVDNHTWLNPIFSLVDQDGVTPLPVSWKTKRAVGRAATQPAARGMILPFQRKQ